MKIYDISQEIFECVVYDGDKRPSKSYDKLMSRGDVYNLSSFEMGSHNGTHIDAPFHFFSDGATVDKIPLEKVVGECYVTEQNKDIDAHVAEEILERAKGRKRILIKGQGVVSAEAARIFAEKEIYLVGVEGLSVGPVDAPMEVHKLLLSAKVVLLEGIRLGEVEEGAYFLSAAPIMLGGCDGAPCRAFLVKE